MTDEPLTLPFESFWGWMVTHPNCILRASTPEAIVYDDEDYHWHFATEGPETLLIQVIRGKRLVAELFVLPEQVSYVQGFAGEQEGEYVFELISESETDRVASYSFVMTHGYETEEGFTPARVH